MDEQQLEVTPGVYRHFKGGMYDVYGVAEHTETGEMLVVYRARYGSHKWYVRPLEMFCSEVDKLKYPDSVQDMRFLRVDDLSLECQLNC